MPSKLTSEERDELTELFVVVDASGYELNDREHRFYAEQQARFERYGVDTYVSAAQWRWLRDILARASR